MILARGVYLNRPKVPVRLDSAVMERVEAALRDGEVVRLSGHDLVKMARSGGYELPKRVDKENAPMLYGYCCSILYNLKPNHGSAKSEQWGGALTYEFVPDVPREAPR